MSALDPALPLTDRPTQSRKNRIMRAIARAGAGPTRPLAGRRGFPLYAILHHTGRRSGRAYAIPIAIQRTAEGFVIPLPFGDATQWARNVLDAGVCTIRWRGRDYAAIEPEVVEWPRVRDEWNPVIRAAVPIIGIRHFMRLRIAEEQQQGA